MHNKLPTLSIVDDYAKAGNKLVNYFLSFTPLVPAKIVSFFLHRNRILKVTTQIQKVQLVKKSQNCDRTAHGLLEGLTLHFCLLLYRSFETKNI